MELRMPRYFICTRDYADADDEAGIELPDRDALRALMLRSLPAILAEEAEVAGAQDVTARAYDEQGQLVMRARASITVMSG
jgi:hypothetical protein